jgi:DNA modification methylase
MKVKNQVVTPEYALYNGDCMDVMPTIADNSIDFFGYSPPFLGLFVYSSSPKDFSNCESREHALQQYEFLVREIGRTLKPGCICAVHCTDLMNSDGSQYDYPHEIEEIHKRHGMKRMNKITIWKEPLKVRMRTMVHSLMHKNIVESSTDCFTAMPDYVLVFQKEGQRAVPVTHPYGLTHYAGLRPFLPEHLSKYGLPLSEFPRTGNFDEAYDIYVNESFKALQKKYAGWEDPKTNKMSHIIWQRYASSTWDDVRIDNVLPFRDAREDDDEKHVHPMQLDVIDRLIELYTNPGEICCTPFAGVSTEVFSPVSMGRKAIGIELKDSYFKQAVKNMAEVTRRFDTSNQAELFEDQDWIENVYDTESVEM